MQEFLDRIDNLVTQCRRIENTQARQDLMRMCDSARSTATELSKELVECRRRNKMSPRSTDLAKNLEESIVNIEKMLLFAKLMYPSR